MNNQNVVYNKVLKSYFDVLIKISKNKMFYISRGLRLVYSILFYPFNIIRFNSIGLFSYISPISSVRNSASISIGNHVHVNSFVVLWPTLLKIGDYSQINPGTAIYGNVVIGKYVMIAPNCMIAGGNHKYNNIVDPMIFQGSFSKGIVIEDDVWIGANSTILDGVTIGKGAIIAAGSTVAKDVFPFDIVAGGLSKKIASRLK